jgi:hypothetical protein
MRLSFSLLVGAFVLGGLLFWQYTRSLPIPSGAPERTTSVTISLPNDNATTRELVLNSSASPIDPPSPARRVMVTEGVAHTIPLEDIRSGGPGKDGIPSIDSPEFVSVVEADTLLDDQGLGVAISVGTIERFYPFQILVWHEIVNDVVNDVPVAITYCPLCGTGFTFERRVNGRTLELGVSGKLHNNNLLMYDRTTESLWQQETGEAVVGDLVGQRLNIFPSANILWRDWKKLHPDGEVLSANTGFTRDYARDPYAARGYYDSKEAGIFPGPTPDPRLHPKTMVTGIQIGASAKAYPWETVRVDSPINDVVGELPIIIFEHPETRAIEIRIRPNTDEITDLTPERIDTLLRPEFQTGFWFSWANFRPETEVYE